MPTTAEWASRLPQFVGQHMPDAVANGLNRTGSDAQLGMRQQLYLAFTIRSANTAQWFEKMVKIWPRERATRYKLSTTVRMEGTESGGPAATRRARQLLWRHEDGGVHSPANTFFGAFVMPGPGMRTATSNPPRSLYPTSLGLQPRRTVEGTYTKAGTQGKRRTYIVPNVGVFQRVGKDTTIGGDAVFWRGANGRFETHGTKGQREYGSIPLWWFYRQPIHLSPRLKFHQTIDRITRANLVPNIQGFIGLQLRNDVARASRGAVRGVLSGVGFGG